MLFTLQIALLSISGVVKGEEIELSVTPSCSYQLYSVDSTTSYVVKWQGEDPGMLGCRIGFRGSYEGDVCLETKQFYLQGPGIELKYTRIGSTYREREMIFTDSFSPMKTYCTEEGEYFRIEIDANTKGWGAAREDTSQSYFTIRVTSTDTEAEESSDQSWGIMGIIGIVVVILLAVLVCCCRLKSNRQDSSAVTLTPVLNRRSQGVDSSMYATVHSSDPLSNRASPLEPSSVNSSALNTPQRNFGVQSSFNTGMQSSFNSRMQSDFTYPTQVALDRNAEPEHSGYNPPDYDEAEALFQHRDMTSQTPQDSDASGSRRPEIPPPSYAEVMSRIT